MDSKPYPEKKRRLLVEQSVEEFVVFLEEIKGEAGEQVLRMLTPSGYSKRSRKSPKRRIRPQVRHSIFKQFVSRLQNLEKEISNPESQMWDKFKHVWVLWIQSHHELNKIWRQLDNEADFEGNQCIADPNSELDIKCFRDLMEASRKNQIDQETIQRFYNYGYFLPSEEIEDLIDQAIPRTEIEQRRRLAALPDQVDELQREIESLERKFSTTESVEEMEQKLSRRITEANESFKTQLAETKSIFNKMVGELRQSINSLKSWLSQVEELEQSVKSLETQLSTTEFANEMKQEIARLDQRIQEIVLSFEDRLAETEREEQLQATDAPRIANRAVQIGEDYAAELGNGLEHYQDENDYLIDFPFCLDTFGVTDSEDLAKAIHVALKAFPALEISDTRLIEVWRLVCGNHLHVTTLEVELGWLGLQDWFPHLFSDECFGEQLKRKDLAFSILEMLRIGDMPWAIHFRSCDRSFPESYLPQFLDWINANPGVKVFLTRCSGPNRCDTSFEVYDRVARLPNPKSREPIESRNLKPSGLVTRSDWVSWCQPASGDHCQPQLEFLDRLRTAIENNGVILPLRDIRCYLLLSHQIFEPTKALDWALILRLLPWIENRRELVETVQDLIGQANLNLPHFQNALRGDL